MANKDENLIINILCFRHLSESPFFGWLFAQKCAFANFWHYLMQNRLPFLKTKSNICGVFPKINLKDR